MANQKTNPYPPAYLRRGCCIVELEPESVVYDVTGWASRGKVKRVIGLAHCDSKPGDTVDFITTDLFNSIEDVLKNLEHHLDFLKRFTKAQLIEVGLLSEGD